MSAQYLESSSLNFLTQKKLMDTNSNIVTIEATLPSEAGDVLIMRFMFYNVPALMLYLRHDRWVQFTDSSKYCYVESLIQ